MREKSHRKLKQEKRGKGILKKRGKGGDTAGVGGYSSQLQLDLSRAKVCLYLMFSTIQTLPLQFIVETSVLRLVPGTAPDWQQCRSIWFLSSSASPFRCNLPSSPFILNWHAYILKCVN